MKYSTVLFDLDGTLTDPKAGITTGLSLALKSFGIEKEPDELTYFIGPPFHESLHDVFGFTPEQCAEATARFREYFSRQGWAENVPYPGVAECLEQLKAAGLRLAVATSKPEVFAVRIMEHFSLAQYFDVICGAPLHDNANSVKSAVIRRALDRLGVSDPVGVIMVGDRLHDVQGAHQVGLPAVGVLYGYGSRAELEDSGADYIAADFKELTKILIKEEEPMEPLETRIAKDLLRIRAVFLRPEEPFTWASGIKSPIYCDNRLTLTAPEVRNDVENGLKELIETYYPQAEILMGTSTAGIAHAAITAHLMGLPMGYVRGGAKDHGRHNQIEGRLEPGQKVVVVEDLISTGGSAIDTVNVLREAGADVLGIVSIFTYGMHKGLDRMKEAHVENHSLSNLDALVTVAAREGYIADCDAERIITFRNKPSDESWIK